MSFTGAGNAVRICEHAVGNLDGPFHIYACCNRVCDVRLYMFYNGLKVLDDDNTVQVQAHMWVDKQDHPLEVYVTWTLQGTSFVRVFGKEARPG